MVMRRERMGSTSSETATTSLFQFWRLLSVQPLPPHCPLSSTRCCTRSLSSRHPYDHWPVATSVPLLPLPAQAAHRLLHISTWAHPDQQSSGSLHHPPLQLHIISLHIRTVESWCDFALERQRAIDKVCPSLPLSSVKGATIQWWW